MRYGTIQCACSIYDIIDAHWHCKNFIDRIKILGEFTLHRTPNYFRVFSLNSGSMMLHTVFICQTFDAMLVQWYTMVY